MIKTVQLSRLKCAVAVLAADCCKGWRKEEKMRGAPKVENVVIIGWP